MADRTVTVRLRALTSDYTTGLQRAGAQTAAFATRNQKSMDMVGKAALGIGAGMLTTSVLAGRAAMRFESSFAGVRKTVSATEAEFAKLEGGFRRMATEIPVTVEEINGIGEAAGQLGVKTENIESFTRTMADLGVATNMSSDQAATSLARLANITQLPQEQFDRLGSVVVHLGNNLATTESEIVEMGLRIAGAGNQIGLAEAEILAISGTLSSVGIRAEAGGTAISRVMIEIASEVETGGEKLAMFAETAGMSAQQFAAQWRADPAEALVAFISGLGRMEEQGTSTLQTLEAMGITEIRMRDALLRSAGAGDLLAESIRMGNSAWEENNALTKEAAQRYETAESRMQIAKNRINDAMIDMGSTVLPMMAGVAEGAANVASMFQAMPEPMRAAAGASMFVGGAFTVLGGAALIAVPKVIALNTALASTGGIAGTARASLAGTARFLTGPWGVAIAGVTAGLVTWINYQNDVREGVERLRRELDGAPASLDNYTEAMVATRLQQAGLLTAAHDAGLSLDTLRAAINGNADAMRQVKEATGQDYLNMWENLKVAIPGVRSEESDLYHMILRAARSRHDYNDELKAQGALLEQSTRHLTQAADGQWRLATTLDLVAGGSHRAAGGIQGLGGAAAGTTPEMGDLGEATEEAVSIFDAIPSSVKDAFDAFAGGAGVICAYQPLEEVTL